MNNELAKEEGLDNQLKRLEIIKKEEEINQLRSGGRRQWITPTALTALLPLIGGLAIWTLSEVKKYNGLHQAESELASLEVDHDRLQQQKIGLNIEITSLLQLKQHYSQESKDLQAKIKERQKVVDRNYTQMLFDSSEARYAINHVQALPRPNASSEQGVKKFIAQLPAHRRSYVSKIAIERREAIDLAYSTADILSNFDKTLKLIPASDWTQELQWMPAGYFADGRKILINGEGPDKKFFDVDLGRFLTKSEEKDINR